MDADLIVELATLQEFEGFWPMTGPFAKLFKTSAHDLLAEMPTSCEYKEI